MMGKPHILGIMILAIALTPFTVMTQSSAQSHTTVFTTTSSQSRGSGETTYVSTTKQTHTASQQVTTVHLNAAQLDAPHRLKISASTGTRLTGQVLIEGVSIRTLTQNSEVIDLAPYLTRDRQTVEIRGSYQPSSASVQVEFTSPNTQIMQQTSGNGLLRHQLNFEIREWQKHRSRSR